MRAVSVELRQRAAGLDLTDADDRATFRQRLDDYYRCAKLSAVVKDAEELGLWVPRNSRARAIRQLADHVIEEALA